MTQSVPEVLWLRREQASEARGVVIVIDVIRAFSVAAYALARGARELLLVRTVEEAFALRECFPDALLIGEVDGRLISGFDLNNSPAVMAAANVRGRLLIQRTGAGTQGAVGASHAHHLLVAALVNAAATAAYARDLAAREQLPISLLPTAARVEEEDAPAVEDEVCAAYIEALVTGRVDVAVQIDAGVDLLRAVGRLGVFERGYPDFPAADVPAFLAIDRFAFAMVGERERVGHVECVRVRRVEVVSANSTGVVE